MIHRARRPLWIGVRCHDGSRKVFDGSVLGTGGHWRNLRQHAFKRQLHADDTSGIVLHRNG